MFKNFKSLRFIVSNNKFLGKTTNEFKREEELTAYLYRLNQKKSRKRAHPLCT